jgi:hypothetical protein
VEEVGARIFDAPGEAPALTVEVVNSIGVYNAASGTGADCST